MKNKIKKAIFFLAICVCSFFILNMKLTTRQGVNYVVYTNTIPLYLKVLDFFDRHFNYIQLTGHILKDTHNSQERALRLLEWSYNNIKKAPDGLSIVDDHVWHIIIRGYGVQDQFSDVFTTLCNYAGMNAFFTYIHTKDRSQEMPLSFVKVNNKWAVFDPYNGIYFKKSDGEFAGIDEVKSGDWRLFAVAKADPKDIGYQNFFDTLEPLKYAGFRRANIQSPLRRLLYYIRGSKK